MVVNDLRIRVVLCPHETELSALFILPTVTVSGHTTLEIKSAHVSRLSLLQGTRRRRSIEYVNANNDVNVRREGGELTNETRRRTRVKCLMKLYCKSIYTFLMWLDFIEFIENVFLRYSIAIM